VAVVDDVRAPAAPAAGCPAPRQGEDRRGAEEAFQPVVVEAHAQAVADEGGGHGVEDVAQAEAAAAGDGDEGLLGGAGALRRQVHEVGPLGLDEAAAGGIGAADDGIDEGAPGGEVGKVMAAAQQQRPGERVLEVAMRRLEVAMRRLDGAVLVGDAGVVAGRAHAVMGAERLVAAGLVLGGVAAEVAEGGGEAVGAVLPGRATERPEGILQPLGEGGEALAAEHHADVLPAGEGEAEVVEPVLERLAGDADAE